VHGGSVREVADAVLAADWGGSRRRSPRAGDLLMDGLAVLSTQGYATGAPALRRALSAFRDEPMSDDDALRWLWLGCRVARALSDDASWDELSERQLLLARQAGALSLLPSAVNERFGIQLVSGQLDAATSLVAEADAVLEATGSHLNPHSAIWLAVWRGREAEALALIEADRKDVVRRGEGVWLADADWSTAVLYNGAGRYEDALAAVERAAEQPNEPELSTWAAPEFIEAAARSGHAERAAAPLARLSEIARACGTDWALGVEARTRAMLADGDAAERLHREAIRRLGRTRVRVALARAHLLYGEWLRRQNRRVDARDQLRTAHGMLGEMGAEGFAERARRELQATGETVRKRTAGLLDELTPQEAQIARLAGEGSTNAEIGATLFLSPRTVEWHLRKVFTKLGISSRKELRAALPQAGRAAVPA
jgi:DNA-binding CsgD family transcriptional regulator